MEFFFTSQISFNQVRADFQCDGFSARDECFSIKVISHKFNINLNSHQKFLWFSLLRTLKSLKIFVGIMHTGIVSVCSSQMFDWKHFHNPKPQKRYSINKQSHPLDWKKKKLKTRNRVKDFLLICAMNKRYTKKTTRLKIAFLVI
jgi:hypothetical protein